MEFYIVDAFSDELFGGNPAGVVMIPEDSEFPRDEVMRKIAAELRYSETAFLKKKGQGRYQVRYFTPVAEVDLCGHATIGSFYCLAEETMEEPTKDSQSGSCEYIAETLAGEIDVTVSRNRETGEKKVLMGMASPVHIGTITDAIEVDRLYEVMGSEFDQSLGLYPMIISTGLPDIILPVSNKMELDSLQPNYEMLTKISKTYGVTGVHAFAFDTDDKGAEDIGDKGDKGYGEICHEGTGVESRKLYARNFAPLYGIDEEAATGTANGALTYYLYLNKEIESPAECKVIQGEKMGRPSEISTLIRSTEDGKVEIKVGGKGAILASGFIKGL